MREVKTEPCGGWRVEGVWLAVNWALASRRHGLDFAPRSIRSVGSLQGTQGNVVFWVWEVLQQITFFFFFRLFRTAGAASGSSQARGQIRATAAGLRHSHSNAAS